MRLLQAASHDALRRELVQVKVQQDEDERRDRKERRVAMMVSEGWSQDTAFHHPERADVYNEDLDPTYHGVEVPTTNRQGGRKRRRKKPVPKGPPWWPVE